MPALSAINARLLDDYINDCQRGVDRWNRIIEKAGIEFHVEQPHKAFNRRIGEFAELDVSPDGQVMDQATWSSRQHEWLPTESDLRFLVDLMHPVTKPGEFASWIAPPKVGVNQQPGDFEYVRI